VDEVEIAARRQPLEQRAIGRWNYLVPANMRDALTGLSLQQPNLPVDPTESGGLPYLGSERSDELHSKTDPKKGDLSAYNLLGQGNVQATASQPSHCFRKRPHAGQNDARGPLEVGRISGDEWIPPALLDRPGDGVQIAQARVDDGYPAHVGGDSEVGMSSATLS
jgi:hypothetical protein